VITGVEAQIDADPGVAALIARLQLLVLVGVEVDRVRIAEAVDQPLHAALRKLFRVDVAVDVVGLDQARRFLHLGEVDARSGAVAEIRNEFRIGLIDICAR